ncbi:fimbrial protein [Buttiauxella sp. B2]|uniref:fimbrial protein n=1 Tax=Buttiauxella sp. B2 TaxID=2587812 RepID=UPI00111E5D4F|nr:fimbrial protein [Buttiauxella sp. B2]TNV22517.1 fimbrial protein [Buttiauxella sp. B2]
MKRTAGLLHPDLCPPSASMTWRGFLAVFCLMCMLSVEAEAAPRNPGEEFTMDIALSGTVVATGKCTFNQDGTVAINFGDVRYSTLSGAPVLMGGPYSQPMVSAMTCTGDTVGAKMKLDGTSVSFSGASLLAVTDDKGGTLGKEFAIRLMVNGKAQNINEWFNVDTATPPSLVSELVQTGSGSGFVSGATFSSSATLTMAFN